ncbi:hypothetical protein, partial [Acinetobacter johnsonii]|uniref:hypothetical protein n=1 Tax=Acinetobacter johnsonii TaxID=40214 RepID=UPI00244BF66D
LIARFCSPKPSLSKILEILFIIIMTLILQKYANKTMYCSQNYSVYFLLSGINNYFSYENISLNSIQMI